MGKITKTMQPKHRETLSPWLKDFVEAASSAPLPLIPQHLEKFPSRWSFPRGDLYHWIPLLNRFDNILEAICATYDLHDGFQKRDFTCDVLLNTDGVSVDYRDDQAWDQNHLTELGYKEDGDCQLVIAILKFTQMLLDHCGNRSIYASSAHLNDLLNTSSLDVVSATLEVALELAQRYQASVKRLTTPSRTVNTALLANHYNIELDRVQQLAQPFVKTPIAPRFSDLAPTTPTPSSSKSKDKAQGSALKNVASMYANDLVSIATPSQTDESRWAGWGDLKIFYYPKTDPSEPSVAEVPAVVDRATSSVPTTPTPLRRSSANVTQTPRAARMPGTEESPLKTPGNTVDEHGTSGLKCFELRQSKIQSTSIYDLLKECPPDMPKTSQYEFLSRLRICKALLGSSEARQQALAVRLLAITNLAFIHPEATFIEKALKQDNDEPRRYQLVYQLAELIHPSMDSANVVPIWLQTIALELLEAISHFQAKYPDVLSALNANVNHGVLLYVIRKAVAEMKEDPAVDDEKNTDADKWRNQLFSLTLHMSMASRIGQEMISAGLMDCLVEILTLRSNVAIRNHGMILAFLDGLIYAYQGAFTAFSNASGLDRVASLIIHMVSESKRLVAAGQGTKPEFHASLVDYDIPFHHQQTIKWLLKFIHHVMTNAYSWGGNTDRLLRNLVDNSQLLASLRSIIQDMRFFGSVVWTNAATLLGDFINNDPTSFAAIFESGMIQSFLEALTGQPVVMEQPADQSMSQTRDEDGNGDGDNDANDDPSSPDSAGDFSATLEKDERLHPPTQAVLNAPRQRLLAHGILPSSDAINIIPNVLNSISLNNLGMKMVVSSRALESFLEIFESPEHVHCMETDQDLSGTVGGSFDELSRHHPALRPAISNAIIDMVARVRHLANSNPHGWGAKLQVADLDGKPITADESLLEKVTGTSTADKGKDKAIVEDTDVEMVDAASLAPVESDLPKSDLGPDSPTTASPNNEITPYIYAFSQFLNSVIGNSSLKSTLVREGGIELLLDISEAPSLPHDFGESNASRLLSQVIAQLVESSQILGLPSLLNRIQAAVDTLQPLITREGSHPFFAPFLITDLSLLNENGDWDQAMVHKVANGTAAVKALLDLQTLIKTLYQCFPFSSRQGTSTLPPVNVYDYYTRLIKSLGPLLGNILTEEMSIAAIVPQHWTSRKPSSSNANTFFNSRGGVTGNGEDMSLPDVLSGSWNSGDQDSAAQIKRPTQEEQSTIQYRNYQTLRGLLHSIMPSTFPFFQTIGKALLPRRGSDMYTKTQHLNIAEVLAETILEQLRPNQQDLTVKDLHYWIIMLHTVHEMLIDPARHTERQNVQLITPVLIAFKEHGGIESLNGMLKRFAQEILNGSTSGEDASKPKLAVIGMKKILDIYWLIVNGKNIHDSLAHIHLPARATERNKEFGHQLIVELRMAILPVVRELWESDLVEKSTTEVLSKIIDILKTISAADQESTAYRKSDKSSPPSLFKNRESQPFNWSPYSMERSEVVRALAQHYSEPLAYEAIFRANGKFEDAKEYCIAHRGGLAGKLNPIPREDAFKNPPPAAQPEVPPFPILSGPPRTLDSMPEIDRLIGDAIGEAALGELGDNSSDDSNDNSHETSSQHSVAQEVIIGGNVPSQEPATSNEFPETEATPVVTVEDLDGERAKLQTDLIDRCLDVVRAHPDSVFEVSDLINNTILKGDNEEKRTEVGEILANALMSFSSTDDDEEKRKNGRCIAAYAHLLSLLLQQTSFLKASIPTLKQNIGEYLSFLKLHPGSSNEELPPWIPYILLMFETLLSEDSQPVETRWKPPTSYDDPIEQPVFVVKEANLSEDDRSVLLTAILDILPRIGKEESLAVSVLRILVILTRDHTVAKTVGEKKNLQRLFVMAKQLCSAGSGRLKQSHISDSIMIILRHIIEDEDTTRQLMQSEIRQYMTSVARNPRAVDIHGYLRHLSHVALRAPKLFIEVTGDLLKLNRWSPSSVDSPPRIFHILLKENALDSASKPKDNSVEPAVQATEDLTINDVVPSTESADKEMPDVPKTPAHEMKRPVLENPDGVVHFLLCELLNYREVDDKEPPSQLPKESPGPSSDAVSSPGEEQTQEAKDKDKKTTKAPFKPEDHPIFVYRCFLLNCLAELLQSFNRAKVEFINFKRSAPIQTNTPVKPRSSVLIYLLNDLLCLGANNPPMDSVAIKKKAATSNQAQAVLVALVNRTGEKPVDRSRDNFEYDDEPDLLFVRRFVLDTILRAYKEASVPSSGESFDVRYGRMICLAELMSQMIGEKDKDSTPTNTRGTDPGIIRSQAQLKRLMYEKGYLAAITASIAEIDLTFPNVKRTIKYILRVLRSLTKTAFLLSQSDVLPATAADPLDDEIASASSLSDVDDDREETPDLYRNSTLGMLEPGREEDFSEDSEDDDDEMYDDEPYDDELDYGEEMSQDGEDNPSDEDDEIGEMGHIEGLPGDPGVVEVIMSENDDEDEDEDMDEDDEDEPTDEDDEDDDSDDMDDVDGHIEIIDDEGNPIQDDGGSWESDTDEEDEEDEAELDYEAEVQNLQEAQMHALHDNGQLGHFPQMIRAAMDAEDLDREVIRDFEDHYVDDGGEEDDEDEEEDMDDDELYYEQGYPHDEFQPPNMPAGLGWDIAPIEPNHRFRPARSPFPTTPFMIGGGPRDPLGGMFSRPRRHVSNMPGAHGQFDADLDELEEAAQLSSDSRMHQLVDRLIMERAIARTSAANIPADFRSYIRSSNPRTAASNADDGVNPLLLPSNRQGRESIQQRLNNPNLIRLGLPPGLVGSAIDGPLAFINDLVQSLPISGRSGHALSFHITSEGPRGEVRELSIPVPHAGHSRESRPELRRDVYQEPHQVVSFSAEQTIDRWQEEAKMLFGFQHNDKSAKLYAAVLAKLTPAAIKAEKEIKAREEQERRKKEEEAKRREEEQRKEREAKEAEEKAAREKREAEERERAERERAEAAAQAAELAEAEAEQIPQAMEGVESHAGGGNDQQQTDPTVLRVLTTIRGETVDVTDLGIDPDYLAALPEEFREEVIAQTVSARRSQAREQAEAEGENTDVFQEFLEALPEELRMEIVQQERQERRRRERDEQRRQAAAAGQELGPQEMDPASILLTFPPELREQVLMDQGEDLIEHLPPALAAEARALAQRQTNRAPPAISRSRDAVRQADATGTSDAKTQRRTIVQMLDKAGIATLLRLMFVTQQGSIRSYLFEVFTYVCGNRHNRLEVISTLLQILQEGSTDMDAVERSFSQLSVKAKQKDKEPKTPTNLKRTFTNISTNNHILSNSEISPLLVVQQCLDLLVDLSTKNPHIPSLFLTEHETVASTLKRSLSRKGKGKDVNGRSQKYAINSLLGLLDRNLIMESSAVMQLLADLLNKVTYPLQALERRRKEAEEEAKKNEAGGEKAEPSPETANASGDQAPPQPVTEAVEAPVGAAADGEQVEKDTAQPTAESSTKEEPKPEEKKVRQITPPVIPDHNLKLVINIFVARECSSKTFQNTISTIKNLSNIPGAKKTFGEELVRQAKDLSENIVSDLDNLLPHILKAESGTEIQGVALAKFSPGASEQNKLLRVLTALDHLFDSKGKKSDSTTEDDVNKENTKEDLLGSLYWNPTFATMWDKLSACLSAIRQRESMLNVATILLPLIESLMVVCKNTTLGDGPGSQNPVSKELLFSSPPPEDRIAGLFFTFTEEHRRILNELVRHNPKLMSGTFSLLVKNPKVLEFDNKRNYFTRSVHAKTGQQHTRPSYQPLQLSVRREHVFHDSFKSLYFKSGAEMKFGKLNIRFHGEEGVDAGGVTREWFQVLTRQMFDPNYALYIPVSSDRTTFHPNKLSGINDEHLMFFKFIGRIIGKALYEGRLLDCYFSRAVYKRILGKPVSVKDMESFDPDYYKSLVWMLENDITDIIVETFSVEDDEFGVTRVVDLIENGRNIGVTEENKHEYVRLIVEHKLLSSVKEQMEHFLKGFHDIIPEELIAIFNEQELELLISGLPDIDVDDWKSNTEYHNYTVASQQIQWFWRAVRSFDKEERAKLLQFVTGTSKVPLNGFKELEGMNGISRFNIHRDYGNKERLPSSHTCFNQLDLPEYESYDILRSQVLKAITAGSDYFGFA
ncbi:hypothetical protein B0T17DRAFT_27906 [Bombardia bombarda]|uniref:HECT-type E3 ubiquitin transferase n=1 Tax=Bombardia bombarda TaxID=252184 RepID=A0AA40CDQ6_9PEZI|nr:hypothetical protein B0T17DRAFT_27906 [Bombardia bombarda]